MIAAVLGLAILTVPPAEFRVALARISAEVVFAGAVQVTPPGRRPLPLDSPTVRAAGAELRIGQRSLPSGSRFSTANGQPPAVEIRSVPGRSGAPRRYRGVLVLHAVEGKLTVVNRVGIEEYLWGVLPLEIPSTAPRAALEAQAIAARSFALARRGQGRHPHYDFTVAATQAYRGSGPETPACTAAVEATGGRVLEFDGRVVEAVYHRCCGGVTAGAEETWGGPVPYLVPVLDRAGGGRPELDDQGVRKLLADTASGWCREDLSYRWTIELTRADLARQIGSRISRIAPGTTVGDVRDIAVVRRAAGGRVAGLKVIGSGGEAMVTGDRIRRLFGPGAEALRSTLFVIDRRGERLTIRGGGWGHGVGLCQIGAMAMAAAGKSAAEILAHYYSGTRLSGAGEREPSDRPLQAP